MMSCFIVLSLRPSKYMLCSGSSTMSAACNSDLQRFLALRSLFRSITELLVSSDITPASWSTEDAIKAAALSEIPVLSHASARTWTFVVFLDSRLVKLRCSDLDGAKDSSESTFSEEDDSEDKISSSLIVLFWVLVDASLEVNCFSLRTLSAKIFILRFVAVTSRELIIIFRCFLWSSRNFRSSIGTLRSAVQEQLSRTSHLHAEISNKLAFAWSWNSLRFFSELDLLLLLLFFIDCILLW